MTVEELWREVTSALDRSTPPHNRLREALAELVVTANGPARIISGLTPKLPGRLVLLRQLALVMNPSGPSSPKLSEGERQDLLVHGTMAARGDWKGDASYWMFLWLRLMDGDAESARTAAKDLKALLHEGGSPPGGPVALFKRLRGWEDYPREQWVELVEDARNADGSPEFRARLQPILDYLRAGGEKPPPAPAAPTVGPPAQGSPPRGGQPTLPASAATPATTGAKPLQGGPQRGAEPDDQATKLAATKPAQGNQSRSGEPAQPVPAATPMAVKPAQGNAPRIHEPTSAAATTTVAVAKPVLVTPPRSGETTVPAAGTEVKPDPGKPSPAPEPPAPVVATPPPEPQPGGVAPTTGNTAGLAPVEVRQGASEPKEPRPKRAASPKKTASKEPAAATPPSDQASSGGPTTAGGPGPATPPAAGHPPPGSVGELPAVLTELASAVRAISGRLDQIASRTGDGASLEQRLVELERRLAGVERALGETQSDAQRAREEVDRLRTLLREQEQELLETRRERDDATARADDLARRLASADARIAAAESRADQNIHEAFRERDAAVLTFKARLWAAVQAQLSDVTDPTPGEEFASTEEEVLTTRLRSIRDTLRAEGVPP
ncbi:MAG: hypothetical protein JWO38_2849 [Gemmataceae bacterium]|nr:hypothetical protein [Gemmataceae bacterium]